MKEDLPVFIFPAVLCLVGLATCFFAPRTGPNPLFGVRFSFTVSNREAWERSNRRGGLMIFFLWLFVFAVSFTWPNHIVELILSGVAGIFAIYFYLYLDLQTNSICSDSRGWKLKLQWSVFPEVFPVLLLVLGSTVFWVWVLVKCALEDLPEKTKIAWIIAIALTHWFGAGLYLCWRKLVQKEKRARLKR